MSESDIVIHAALGSWASLDTCPASIRFLGLASCFCKLLLVRPCLYDLPIFLPVLSVQWQWVHSSQHVDHPYLVKQCGNELTRIEVLLA